MDVVFALSGVETQSDTVFILCRSNYDELLCRYLTVEETWIH